MKTKRNRKVYLKKYNEEHKEELYQKHLKYKAKPEVKERIRKYLHERYLRIKDQRSKYQKDRYRQNPYVWSRNALKNCEARAKLKGWDFDLTDEWFQNKFAPGICELSKIPFAISTKRGPRNPSIDRRDSSKGYTQDNCRLILWALNAAFSNWGEKEFRTIWEAYEAAK